MTQYTHIYVCKNTINFMKLNKINLIFSLLKISVHDPLNQFYDLLMGHHAKFEKHRSRGYYPSTSEIL